MRNVTSKFIIDTAEVYGRSYYNAPLALYRGDQQLMILSAGTRDEVLVFDDGDNYYLYSGNDSLKYMGLEIVNHDFESVGDIFLQNDYDFAEYARLQPINRVKAMSQHIY